MYYGLAGVGVPGTVGEKISLYGVPFLNQNSDYSIGVETSNLWFNSGNSFKWYTAGVQKMSLDNNGLLNMAGLISSASTSIASNLNVAGPLSASSTLIVGGLGLFNSSVGIGTTSPYAALSVVGSTGVVADIYTATSTTATSTFAGGFDVQNGGLYYDLGTGITSASAFQTT